MSVIVTDQGFGPDDFNGVIASPDEWVAGAALDMANTDDPALWADRLADVPMIRVAFPSSADGRGYTVAARLRRLGYQGRLRAFGHVLSDQYGMARRVGFDEVEINDDLAARQPEDQWLFRADWREHNYQARLRS
ncbi:DUF934 domain-containing protein [Falsirhodobacter sp. alg1]|uniref:DUF934 domain-containing protein n=1 Tax=Falsirhodobacter sp. alg1 TaxID=1472418 RepID=UPI0005F0AB49|nr:DUF934 domain-containing protein [Falsirhodobacter sp. alg1]